MNNLKTKSEKNFIHNSMKRKKILSKFNKISSKTVLWKLQNVVERNWELENQIGPKKGQLSRGTHTPLNQKLPQSNGN